MPRADVTGIHLVVVEVFAVQSARFIAHQAILGHRGGVELHLQLHVLRDREQRGRGLLHQHLARLVKRVDVGRDAIAVLRQRLRHLVAVVALAETEHRKEHALVALALDQALQRFAISDAHVEVTVGRQQDAVHAVFAEAAASQFVGKLYARRAGRGSAGPQRAQRVQDGLLLAHRGRRQHLAGRAGVDHDGHGVGGLQAVEQQRHRALRQRQLVRRVHRAADIQQQHQVHVGSARRRQIEAPDADMHQLLARSPG